VVGAILTPGARQISRVLRVMGLSEEAQFQRYHRVLNRDQWSALALSRILLGLLVATVASRGPLVIGMDETIERRRGRRIRAKGLFRDPVRSTAKRKVLVTGLRWLAVMLLVDLPWSDRPWALPILTVLTPSPQASTRLGRRHKTLAVWARQVVILLHRWLPDRAVVIVGDGEYATLELLAAVRSIATMVTRLRLDAQLYALPPPPDPHRRGRRPSSGPVVLKLTARIEDLATPWQSLTVPHWYGGGERTVEVVSEQVIWKSKNGQPPVPIRFVLLRDPGGQFHPQALLCTDLDASPLQIITWYLKRWQLEVTFRDLRAHLGMETQRQWADRAIARTTPVLMGLYSLVTLLAHPQLSRGEGPLQQVAWYRKTQPTFSDALALVRRSLWTDPQFALSCASHDQVTIPQHLLTRLTETLAYAA
jgi:hypothetical protein